MLEIAGLVLGVIGALGTAWRIFDWWSLRHVRLRVRSFAGERRSFTGGTSIVRGPGINPDVVAVEVVNLSRRVVTADTVGFWDPEVRQLTLIDQPHLPCRLQPGGKLIAFGSVQEFVPLLAVNRRLVPVCTDSEGQRHLGKRDSSLTNHNAAAQNNSTLVGEGQQRETHT